MSRPERSGARQGRLDTTDPRPYSSLLKEKQPSTAGRTRPAFCRRANCADGASYIPEAQIITALKQVEAGRTAEDVAREQGVSKHTIYAWKAKYGGMDVSEAEEVKHLRDENSRLKKLVADLSLDKDMLQSVIRKNSLGS